MNATRATITAVMLCVLLTGCAARMAMDGPEVNDPYEGFNRAMFRTTIALDKVFFRPIALVYRRVPQPLREGVRNFLNNLDSPIIFTNDVLQGETNRAGITLLRAGVNTTFGIGGLIDVGTRWGLQRHYEDFGQTLAVWGVGEGPYIFLPLLGPGNPRDLVGRGVDFAFDPFTWVDLGQYTYLLYVRFGVDLLDVRERNIETFDEIEMNSLDYYASVRSLYRQTRNNEIRNGATEVEDLPDF